MKNIARFVVAASLLAIALNIYAMF